MSTRKVFLDVTIKGKMVIEIEEGENLNDEFDAQFEDGYPDLTDAEINYEITDSK
jgi:hypothetical protein